MLRFGISAAVLCIAATTATAAQVSFIGTAHVETVSQACIDNDDFAVGDFFIMKWSPPNLGTNGPSTRLSFFHDGGGAENATLASGNLVGTKFKTVAYTQIYRGAGTGTASLRITSQVPSPTDTTVSVTIEGDWQDISDIGCDIKFIGTGLKH